MKTIKSRVFVFALLTALLATSLAQLAVYNAQYQTAHSTNVVPTTSLQIKVVSLDGTPLKNAKVTIAESKQTCNTDLYGYTPVMQVPYLHTALCDVTDGEFSFINLVVTCDGFKDVVLYNCLVYKNRTRLGPVVMMFDANQTTSPYIAITEVPPDKWTKEFLKTIKDGY
ncbi:MAG: hypothetical protein IJV77_00730 [Clostridia bacterium]|nr:hypothetical protein [Clostridia bacterium]